MASPQNRLASEASPYLRQHANNPVDWYPWGEEALAKSTKEDKPILLSIGYAACHWCHVMERESFEHEPIARLMNDLFVSIKVDREERPDLDQIYQLVVQLMGRSGGWPLTVFLTPDQRPFFAGTYFPPTDRHGMPGFPKVLEAVSDAYRNRRADVQLQAQELTQAIARVHQVTSREVELGPDLLRKASRKLLARFDDRNGGFGNRPKFPNTMSLEVLMRRGVLENDSVCAASVRLALDRMRAGGIWDHLRGGFHRYSTDERWLVPHFEKMLYDNALLLRLYVEGHRAFEAGGPPGPYAETARELVGYLFAEMVDETGGFYSSQDADSEGEEGKFFVWTLEDLRAAVGDDDVAFDVARLFFGISEEGNFENSKATVLSAHRPLDAVGVSLGKGASEVEAALARAKERMLAWRERRPRPARDDKVLASWNGLMIGALADAGRALDEPSWVTAAARAFAAIEQRLIEGGRVRRYFKDGAAAPSGKTGFLDDHSYVGNAALDLYEATHDPRYVQVARAIADAMIVHFWEAPAPAAAPAEPGAAAAPARAGGFYFTPDDGDTLIARTKDAFDQAIPSGASMASLLCLRLGEIADPKYLEPAQQQLALLAGSAIEDGFAMGQTVCVLDRLVRGSVDVVIVGDLASPAVNELTSAAFRSYLPNRNVITIDPARPETAEVVKVLAEGKEGRTGEVVAYVCRGRTCSLPVTRAAELSALLRTPAG